MSHSSDRRDIDQSLRVCVGVVVLPERLSLARRVLEDLTAQTYPAGQVVVVLQGVEAADAAPIASSLHADYTELRVTVIANPQRAVNTGRNLVLDVCTSDIVVVMDDDARMPVEAISHMVTAFRERPEAAVVTFKTNFVGEGTPPRAYPRRSRRRRSARSVTSAFAFEIVASIRSITDLGVRFDERFGPGARFGNGEEFIFLTDVLRAGGEVWFVPRVIAEHPAQHTGSKLERANVEVRGAMLRRVFGASGVPIGWLFVLRKALIGELGCSVPTGLRAIVDGWQRFGRAGASRVPASTV